jgi:hypothetical protein
VQTDAVDFAMQPSLWRVTHPIQRKLDARRAAIHRQHVRLFLLHEMIAPLFKWVIFSAQNIILKETPDKSAILKVSPPAAEPTATPSAYVVERLGPTGETAAWFRKLRKLA